MVLCVPLLISDQACGLIPLPMLELPGMVRFLFRPVPQGEGSLLRGMYLRGAPHRGPRSAFYADGQSRPA